MVAFAWASGQQMYRNMAAIDKIVGQGVPWAKHTPKLDEMPCLATRTPVESLLHIAFGDHHPHIDEEMGVPRCVARAAVLKCVGCWQVHWVSPYPARCMGCDGLMTIGSEQARPQEVQWVVQILPHKSFDHSQASQSTLVLFERHSECHHCYYSLFVPLRSLHHLWLSSERTRLSFERLD